MVEANPPSQQQTGDQDDAQVQAPARKHAHFDEEEIAAYDLTRGQCMPIDDPKTPFAEEESDEEMNREEEQESA